MEARDKQEVDTVRNAVVDYNLTLSNVNVQVVSSDASEDFVQYINTKKVDVDRYDGELRPNHSKVFLFGKRVFDVLSSTLAMILLSPMVLLVALAIKIEDPKGKVFYHQPRIGLNGRTFNCHKLRSMYSNADEIKAKLMSQNEMDGPVFKMKNDPRITKVGKFIRKTSIDELPQLWNVLIGEMSVIGPRPLPVAEELACTPYQRQRELVLPGLSCYWQVSGRSNVMFDEWIELDLKYIREQSFLTDMKILLKTIPAVVSSRGAE